ncbi:MAG: glycosyltransferase [Bryobacterales bacterium]|nr:glycosyltransferase [Bryobacterales bacterium]
MNLAIVCPMANEARTAEGFVTEVLAACEALGEARFLAVLDRVSRDGTFDILRALERRERRLTVVWAPENRCVVDAYVRGYREALASKAGWILEIDAGYSHRPADVPAFLRTIEQGYECAFGTRFGKGGRLVNSSLRRRMISQGGTLVTNLLLRTQLSDMTSGFQLFRRDILEDILRKGIVSRSPFFQTEMKAYCMKRHYAEVPILYSMASHNVSAGSIKESFQQLFRLYGLKRSGRLAI